MLNYLLKQVDGLIFLEKTEFVNYVPAMKLVMNFTIFLNVLMYNISNSRVICLPKYFITNPNVVKFETLFNVTNKNQLTNICKLLVTIFERVSSLG